MITQNEKKWFDSQINNLDPDSNLITINDTNNTIEYSSKVKSSENRAVDQDRENYVHALFLLMMCSDEYKYQIENFVHEQQWSVGSSGSAPKQLDYLLKDPNGNNFALIELKQYKEYKNENKREIAIKEQLFPFISIAGNPRLLILATIEPKGKVPIITADVIDLKNVSNYDDWVKNDRPSFNVIPTDYFEPDFVPLRSQGNRDLKKDCSTSYFKELADKLHNQFFGEHPDNTLFLNLVKCLLAKIYDERQCKDGHLYDFQVFKKNGKEEDARQVFERVNRLYSDAYERYIEPNAPQPSEIDPKEFSFEKVKQVVLELQELSLTQGASLNGDIIGAFFENILRAGFKQDKGMYFTHANIARFMLEVIDLDGLACETFAKANHPESRLPHIIDPACGSGTFLMQAMHIMSNAIRSNKSKLVNDSESKLFFDARMSDRNPNYWAENFIYGFDPKFIMAITTKVNMVLHGDGATHVFKYDAFNSFKNYFEPKLRPLGQKDDNDCYEYKPLRCESFDVVISNPPFGVTLSKEIEKDLKNNFSLSDKLPTESLFIERAFQLLKEKGRLALVLPESIFNTSDSFSVRLFLYRMFNIKAIVSLPRNIFIDTPTLTSLLFAQKKTTEQILKWDRIYNNAKQKAEVLIKEARSLVNTFNDKNISEISNDLISKLKDIIPQNEFILQKGKNAKVIRFKYEGTEVEEIKKHYKNFLKNSQYISHLIELYAFKVTVQQLNYTFSVCHVDEIGYKLSKRGEKARPNQLCSFVTDDKNQIDIFDLNLSKTAYTVKIDTKNPKTALDFLRKEIQWD